MTRTWPTQMTGDSGDLRTVNFDEPDDWSSALPKLPSSIT